MNESKSLVLQQEATPALFGDIETWFFDYERSKDVRKLASEYLEYSLRKMNPKTIENDKADGVALLKKIEAQRQYVNAPITKIKNLNQEIFKTLADRVEEIKKQLVRDYDTWDREEKRKAAERQAELDEERRKEIERREAEAEKKREEAREKGEPEPEIKIEEPVRVVVAEVATKKSVLQAKIEVKIKDKTALARHLLTKNRKSQLKPDVREITFITTFGATHVSAIQELVRQNQGNLKLIQELESAGVDFTGSRGYGVW